ncbi:galactarate/glucarate/glycerate transporter GarP [soil metagenome]
MTSHVNSEIAGGLAAAPLRPEIAAALRGPWTTVFVMQFLYVIAMIDRNLVSLLVAPIKQQLKISDFEVSLLQGTAFGLFFVLCGLFTGWLLDTFARRRVVYWGVSFWSICAASCGLANSYGRLLIGRFGVGAGEAVLSPASYAMISAQFPRERLGFAMGVFATGSIIGGALSLSLGGMVVGWLTERGPIDLPVVGLIQPWQQAFLFFGLPGLVLAPLVFLISRDVDRPKGGGGGSAGDLMAFLRQSRAYLTMHFIGFGFVMLMAYGQSAWLPTYMLRHFGLPLSTVGNMLALSSATGGIVGFLFAGRLTDKWFGAGMLDAHFRYSLIATIVLTTTGIIAYLVPSPAICILMVAFTYVSMAISGLAAANLQIATPPPLRAGVGYLSGRGEHHRADLRAERGRRLHRLPVR